MTTFKQLLNTSVEEQEKWTEEQLEEYCKPFLKVVELSSSEEKSGVIDLNEVGNGYFKSKKKKKDDWELEAQRLMNLHGIKVPEKPKELQ